MLVKPAAEKVARWRLRHHGRHADERQVDEREVEVDQHAYAVRRTAAAPVSQLCYFASL
jgi:hypothetical protein